MSYSPMIGIETETGESILSCDFSSGGYPSLEGKLFDMISDLVRQGLASYSEDTKDRYPATVIVHKATDAVKKIMLPVVEEIVARGLHLRNARYHYELTAKRIANNADLKPEYEEWKMKVENGERYNVACLEALRSFPSDEGFIITAWGTL